jgi:uncharacterized membrane protein YraQ (UPF0718 family)
MSEEKKFIIIVMVFLAAYFIPFGHPRIEGAILEGFHMLQEYAREHVLLCLIPALFIAGAIANFISQGAVIKYFGRGAKRWISYLVASVSGTILAVCSCTVLPLFAGIYKRGAGIGPAITFLYAGPAINLLAIILTARILGWELGVARAIGAIISSVLIGLLMAAIYDREDEKSSKGQVLMGEEDGSRSPIQNIMYFVVLTLILVFAAWGRPDEAGSLWSAIYDFKLYTLIMLFVALAYILRNWFKAHELKEWVHGTWGFAKEILPLLFIGVFIAGILMGRPGIDAGLIPSEYVAAVVGGNSLRANLVAATLGAFMYFATLTEVPILQGLMGSGMGQGPALSLLLAGPALSLPAILVLRSVLGTKKTATFVVLVIIMATLAGNIYGALVA